MSNEFDNWEDEPPEPITNIYTPDPPPPPDNGELSTTRSLAEQVSESIALIDGILNADPGASPPPELPKEDPAVKPVEVVRVAKCTIDSVLPASVINLIKVAPQNNTVRAVILAHLNVTIPDECVSYAQIKKWIEFNYEPVVLDWPTTLLTRPNVPVPPRHLTPIINFSFTASENEYGNARYSVEKTGHGAAGLAEREILEEADGSDTWNDFIDNIRQLVDENVMNNVNWDSVPGDVAIDGGYRYSERESTDNCDFEWNWNEEEVKNALRVILDRLLPGKSAEFDSQERD